MLGAIALVIVLTVAWDVYRNNKDINNLYASRDALWRELHNEVQARKRQNTILRGRIHGLREKIKLKKDIDPRTL